jgi:hypothetical protein
MYFMSPVTVADLTALSAARMRVGGGCLHVHAGYLFGCRLFYLSGVLHLYCHILFSLAGAHLCTSRSCPALLAPMSSFL